MSLTPIPLTVDGTGPDGAIPVSLHGEEIVSADDISIRPIGGLGPTNLQEFLEELWSIVDAIPTGG